MRKFITAVLAIILCFNFLHAQNLVPNPSFEDFSQCPDTFSQINYATGWSSFRDDPDYYNACSTSPNFTTPRSLYFGYQQPASGEAYAGFYAYHNSATNLREYLGVHLITPLEVGEKYFASMKINLMDSVNFGVNKVGILFSTHAFFDANSFGPTINFAHVYTDSVITNTVNWTTISGWLIADSSYEYLVIGCFFDDDSLSKIRIDSFVNPNWGFEYAQYLVDDVSVYKDSLIGINEAPIKDMINIYSECATGKITISSKAPEYQKVEVGVFDLAGKPMSRNQSLVLGTLEISTANFQSGIYIVNISIENKRISKKIFITK